MSDGRCVWELSLQAATANEMLRPITANERTSLRRPRCVCIIRTIHATYWGHAKQHVTTLRIRILTGRYQGELGEGRALHPTTWLVGVYRPFSAQIRLYQRRILPDVKPTYSYLRDMSKRNWRHWCQDTADYGDDQPRYRHTHRLLDSFCVCIIFVWLYIACMCSIVTWWGGPGGIEAWSLVLLLLSVLSRCWLRHSTIKTRPRYDCNVFSGTLNGTQLNSTGLTSSSTTRLQLILNKYI